MSLFRPIYVDRKTGIQKESAVWWFEFVYAGKRYRESTKSTRKTLAADCEKRRRLELEKHHTEGVRPESAVRMLRTVAEAVEDYVTKYDAPNHKPKSIAWVKERTPHLKRLLGRTSLMDLSEIKVTQYMKLRNDEGSANRTINMELLCLSRAVGKTWKQLWPTVPRLDEETDVGRALSPEEEGRLLGAAAKNKSPHIELFIRIGLLTGMRSGEILSLQVNRINLEARELRVGKAKSKAGVGRGIPMNDALFETVSTRIAWLESTFGKPEAKWYLFPFCNRRKPIDPTRSVTAVKTAWESVRSQAGVECRPHDLRHTAATKMAENDVPEATMKALLGHMSRQMIERYSHIRNEAKRNAMKGLTLATPIIVLPKVSPKVVNGAGRR